MEEEELEQSLLEKIPTEQPVWWRWPAEQVFQEIAQQWYLAGPMVAVNVFLYAVLIISLAFVGHLGTNDEFAAASLAVSMSNVLGFHVMLGMGSALETVCGQAFGAGEFCVLGIQLQRATLVMLATCIPLTCLFIWMGPLLILLGQDVGLSNNANEYALWLIPGLYAMALLQPFMRFLLAQGLVMPMCVISVFISILHVLLCWMFMVKLNIGFCGAALAISATFWINYILLVGFVAYSRACSETWKGFSRQALSSMLPFLQLSLSSAAMVCLEYWSFEILILLSGLLPNPDLQLSASSICIQTITLNYMVPSGLSAAASTRVSIGLGGSRADSTLLAIVIAVGTSILQASTFSIALLLASGVWPSLFSKDAEVVHYTSTLLPLIAFQNFLDSIQGVLSGICRGFGLQHYGAIINLGGFYCIGIPCVILFTFVLRTGAKGIWIGQICGLTIQAISLMITLFFVGKKRINELNFDI